MRYWPVHWPDGFGEKVHIASPIRQTGASKSQIPIPSLLPVGAASGTGKAGAANRVWVGDPGGIIAAGNGEFGMLFEFGRKSRCGVAWVQGRLFGLDPEMFWTAEGNEAGSPVAVVECVV